jgi:hypothetical protein
MEVAAARKQSVEPVYPTKHTEPAQKSQKQEVHPKANEAKGFEHAKASTPVVNTRGQTTGRLLNVTA